MTARLARPPSPAVLGALLLAAVAGAAWVGAAADGPARVRARVTEAGTGRLLPARLTLVDAAGRPAEFRVEPARWLAHRPGVVYTGTGEADLLVPAGRYTLYATRGLEYGLGRRELTLAGGERRVDLRLAREVDTRGYVACDPHIHTLTLSGHGDATLDERMATIAGEGIELAIATEHNHHADYAPAARATGTAQHFTPVIGNEVTTRAGHFNIFPIRPGTPPPDAAETDWARLIPAMRAVPGVRVVVLNHPSNDHAGFIPTDPRRFHAGSGESLDGRRWDFDGIEVVTSAALQSDWMKPYRDWFALLNHGSRVAGMGSSDSHDVDRFILGQGRTYVAAPDDDPGRVDVQAACDGMLAGRVLASMGLLTEAWVDGRGPGETSLAREAQMRLRVRVQGPRWIGADRLEVYANGEKVVDRPLASPRGAVVKADLTLSLARPRHDVWLVAIASGPGVSAPYWPIPRPYQPNRAEWDPRVLGSTNAIRVDGDGDGRYSSARDYAERAVREAGGDASRLMAALQRFDTAVAIQAAALCRARGAPDPTAVRRAADRAAAHVRHGFVAYQNLLPR